MRALINGSLDRVVWAKGTDNTALVLLMNDDGSPLTLTGGAVDLVVYDRSDRLNAAIATHSGDALTSATGGLATVTVARTELTYGPSDYYIFARFTTSGALVYFSTPYVLHIA